MRTKYLTRASAIAALYVILVVIEIPLGSLAFGPVQIRIAEALVLLPLVDLAAIPGVFVGCMLANFILTFFAPFGIIDVFGGSLVTLTAAYLTSKTVYITEYIAKSVPQSISDKSKKILNIVIGSIPPVVLNALIISIWISEGMGVPYWFSVTWVGIGQIAAVGLLGSIVLYAYERIKDKI